MTSVICAPDWPCFSMNPVGWHPAIDPEKEDAYWQKTQRKKQDVGMTKKQKKEKKKRDKKERKRLRKEALAAKLRDTDASPQQIKEV